MDLTPTSLIRNLTENPVNWVLGGVALYMLYSITSKSAISALPPPQHPEVIELREFTPKELVQYDGKDNKPIYIGVNGRVYDVSRGRGFYGPGAMYGNFAGRDASRGLAKNSFDEDMLTDPNAEIDKLEDLDQEEWQSLRDWAGFFEGKYDFIGTLVENR